MAHHRPVLSVLLGLMLMLGCSSVLAAAEDVIAEARSALEANEPQKAYETLAAREGDYAGNTEFDYWLGLAAVRAGEYGHATFALERAVANNPEHAGARLELAAAYLALGQESEAGRQLDRLQTMDPPEEAQKRIDELSERVARRTENQSRKDELFYIALEAGHDNNAGTWPDTTLDILPGNVAITPVDSAYYGARAGGSRNFRVAPDQKVGVTGQLYTRRHDKDDMDDPNQNADQFDQDFGLLQLRWLMDLDGRREIETGVEGAQLRLDGEDFYKLTGVYGTWRNDVSKKLSYDANLRLRDLAFEAETNDYKLWSLGTSLQYQLAPRWRLDSGLRFEREDANADRRGGDADIIRVNGKTRYAFLPDHILTGSLQYSYAGYQDEYPPFSALNLRAKERSDDRYEASLGWEWFFANDWRARLEARYREQQSNLDLFSYDRTLGTLSITRYF